MPISRALAIQLLASLKIDKLQKRKGKEFLSGRLAEQLILLFTELERRDGLHGQLKLSQASCWKQISFKEIF